MTTYDKLGWDIDALDRALECYGADRTRWPLEVRRGLSHLIATNAEAARRLREAEALDRVMDQAPSLSAAARAALVERIVTAGARQPRIAAGQRLRPKPPIGWREHGFAAMALAASLVLGVIAGGTAAIGPAAEALVAAGSTDSGTSGQQFATTDEAEGLLDEDFL